LHKFPLFDSTVGIVAIVNVEVLPCPLTSGHAGGLASAAGAIAGSVCNFAMFTVFTWPLSKP